MRCAIPPYGANARNKFKVETGTHFAIYEGGAERVREFPFGVGVNKVSLDLIKLFNVTINQNARILRKSAL
jgi:hypothetical protein